MTGVDHDTLVRGQSSVSPWSAPLRVDSVRPTPADSYQRAKSPALMRVYPGARSTDPATP